MNTGFYGAGIHLDTNKNVTFQALVDKQTIDILTI